MKRIAFVLTCILLFCGTSWAQTLVAVDRPTTVENGQLTFALPDLVGNIVTHDDAQFLGKVVLVDIWGTWCGPCRRKIPWLIQMNNKYRAQGLRIVGIAFEKFGTEEEQITALRNFATESGINYTLLLGGSAKRGQERTPREALPTLQHLQVYPTLVLIDRAGRVQTIESSYASGQYEVEVERQIKRLLWRRL